MIEDPELDARIAARVAVRAIEDALWQLEAQWRRYQRQHRGDVVDQLVLGEDA